MRYKVAGESLMKQLETTLNSYGRLLAEVDAWFTRCLAAHPQAIACRSGCSECCRGLFDITLLDACYLKSGFNSLPSIVREEVREKVLQRLVGLKELWPDFDRPYLLNYRPEEEWEALMPDDDETPCPLLAEDGRCLVYDHRPMTCRLHGIPLLDVSGELLHDEWCTLNFTGDNPLEMEKLRWEFTRLFKEELLLFRQFTTILFKHPFNELDTFIPTALLIDFDRFDWKEWGEKLAR
ncbi:MAG: hypothetical protein FD174_49 [Geobacteraceae bacterium]|nr:MAG: hypothetical protein FD174_49 [Geobacteraceae bacterium]